MRAPGKGRIGREELAAVPLPLVLVHTGAEAWPTAQTESTNVLVWGSLSALLFPRLVWGRK